MSIFSVLRASVVGILLLSSTFCQGQSRSFSVYGFALSCDFLSKDLLSHQQVGTSGGLFILDALPGIGAEVKVKESIWLGASYSFWSNTGGSRFIYSVGLGDDTSTWIGSIAARGNYKFVDGYLKFKLEILKGLNNKTIVKAAERNNAVFKNFNQTLGAAVGISYAWGINVFCEDYFISNLDTIFWYYAEEADYFGLIALMQYNANFFNQRFTLGADLQLRYFAAFNAQLSLGFHAGVNF